jgi:5-methylcytosine-specific restriction endonuclease McrA
MRGEYVWVEVNDVGNPVRIFRTRRVAYAFGKQWIASWWRSTAVKMIRHQVFLRSHGECEWCAVRLTENSGHLHEVVHRGHGGEMSIENSVFICYDCHLGPKGAHGSRRPRFGEKNHVRDLPLHD